MKQLFHPSLYEFDKPQPSYWEASTGNLELHSEPLAFLRRHYVRAGLSFYRLRDIFDI
jgi:hypothetical protein